MMKKWFVLVTLVLVMVIAGEVWGIRAASAAAKPIKLRMMIDSEPVGALMVPSGTWGPKTVLTIVCNVMEPLVDVGKKGEPVPKLATKWEHSADFTKWRFYLRRGVKFHNGDNFTARDVVELAKWNFEEKEFSRLYQRVPIKEAIAVNDYTVDFIFEKPQPLLLVTAYLLMIPPASISRDNRKMIETHPIGTGPYRFVEWKKGLYVKQAKFEGYWGPKPQIDEVEITFREEEAVRLAALIAGEVDWVSHLSPEQAKRAPKVVHIPSPDQVFLWFDEYIQKELGGNSILGDKRLRLAIDYAIDREALVSLHSGFLNVSQGQMASRGDFGFNPNLKSRPYDLEKARAQVREAGAVGKTLTLVASSDKLPHSREVAEALTNMIEKTGLKIKLMVMPHNEAKKYKDVWGENRKLKADIGVFYTTVVLEAETNFSYIFTKDGAQCGTPDPESDRFFIEATTEADYAKRGKKLGKAWEYVYGQAHYIPLYRPETLWGCSKNLEWKVDPGERPFIADMRFTN